MKELAQRAMARLEVAGGQADINSALHKIKHSPDYKAGFKAATTGKKSLSDCPYTDPTQ